MTLGHKIKILLAFHDLTNKDLANKLDVSGQRVSHYINDLNRPPLNILSKMADIFQVSLDLLANEKYQFHIVYNDDTKHRLENKQVAELVPEYNDEKINFDKLTDEQKELIKKLIKTFKKPE
jgi:transcriptional regulator with XRE-family HTH domain